jgi:phospholipid-translocating ATPase
MLEEADPLVIDNYCKILPRASSVIFCRTSPKEKALIAKYVKRNLGFVVLGIGDGGNDVVMI